MFATGNLNAKPSQREGERESVERVKMVKSLSMLLQLFVAWLVFQYQAVHRCFCAEAGFVCVYCS